MAQSPSTVPELLERNRTWRAGHDAVVTRHDRLTHDELEASSRVVAARLGADGVARGSRVGLLAENGIDWVVAAVAVMRLGGVLVPLSTLLSVGELRAQLAVAEVGLVLATGAFKGRDLHAVATEAASGLDPAPRVRPLHTVVAPAPPADADRPEPVAAPPPVRPDDDLVVLFTSGSRGTPKGTLHTHRSATLAISAGLTARCVGPDDRVYLPMPLFWTGGFSSGLFTMLVAGSTLLTEAEPDPPGTLALLEAERATLFRGWPDQAARLAEHPARAQVDLSSLRDASLPAMLPEARRPAPGARPNLLGMTESFGPYCAERLDRDLPPELHGCCGRPFPGIEVQVVDPASGEVVPSPVHGELWLRGPSLLRGICGRSPSEVFTPEGWYRTGDLGRIDQGGHVWFEGRLDDMFKVSGASVYPSEVETALRALDGVREAHVVAVPGEQGPRVGALVVGDRAATELRALAREQLSPFKVPTCWFVTTDAAVVPRGGTGKVELEGVRALLVSRGERASGT